MGRRPRNKDPAAPKAASSAQQFFAKSRRDALKKAKPDLSSADLQKALADEWRALAQNKRAPFIKKAAEDKKRFLEESANYVPDPSMLKATKGGKRLQKDPLRPKKPRSAYLYFGEATRAELASANPGIRIEMLSKLIGEEWKKLSVAAKKPYDQLAEQDQERYKEEMKNYTPSEAYLAAREAFKIKKKRLAKGLPVDDDDDEGGEEEESESSKEEKEALKKENKELKAQVKTLEKELEKASKKVEKLEGKIEKAAEKAAVKAEKVAEKAAAKRSAPSAKEAKPAKAAKTKAGSSASAPVVIEDEAHYVSWTKKLLGAKGEKADEEMVAAMEAKGAKGVVALLKKKYKAEHK